MNITNIGRAPALARNKHSDTHKIHVNGGNISSEYLQAESHTESLLQAMA